MRDLHVLRFFCLKARQAGLLNTHLFVAIEQVFVNKQAGQAEIFVACLLAYTAHKYAAS